MKENYKLMGTIVEVNKIYRSIYKDNVKINEIVEIQPQLAWITGFSRLNEGFVNVNETGINNFKKLKIIPCICIKFFYNQKEIKIPLDGFVDINVDYDKKIDILKKNMSLKYNKIINNHKYMERDKNGHFLKKKKL